MPGFKDPSAGWTPTPDQQQQIANDSRLQKMSRLDLYYYFGQKGSNAASAPASPPPPPPKQQPQPAAQGWGLGSILSRLNNALSGH